MKKNISNKSLKKKKTSRKTTRKKSSSLTRPKKKISSIKKILIKKGKVSKPTSRKYKKIDPRLEFLLSLPLSKLKKLKKDEKLILLQREHGMENIVKNENFVRQKLKSKIKSDIKTNDLLYSPISWGVFFPEEKDIPVNIKTREPFISAFILSSASVRDLNRLGIKVRNQFGNIFTAFIPFSAISKLEELRSVHYIELSRPLVPDLDDANPYAQLDQLQGQVPPINGTGVIVGIVDSQFDVHHPDFQTAGGTSRVLFLWDQFLAPQIGESGPPIAPALPGFNPIGGATYGVEYSQNNINNEINNLVSGNPAYQIVRSGGGARNAHGTFVAGCAAGNGLAQGGTFTGAAPAASIIYVNAGGTQRTALVSDSAFNLDAFAYIFARTTQLGQACVVNMSRSDNQGAHDGTNLGEQALDNLLLTPGRAITLSAGNVNNLGSHASGQVPSGGNVNLILNYFAADITGDGNPNFPMNSDAVEIWYDGHDSFNVTLTIPTTPATVIGPIAPGNIQTTNLPNGIQVQVSSIANDGRNGDNLISIILTVPTNQVIPLGNWTINLADNGSINGNFQAWIDRNNRRLRTWQAPFLQENQLTIAVPATARRPISVGSHDIITPTPNISGSSSRGPSRDNRIKPEIATVGANVTAPRSRNMNDAIPGALYRTSGGTSFAAPIVAGACASIFQCRGINTTWANLKQILADTAGTAGLTLPNNSFGFGFMQVGNSCTQPVMDVDVWLRDNTDDTGIEPYTGSPAWLSPDIEILDNAGNPVNNPTYDPTNRFNNIVRVTVRNRGSQMARNTEVYLYWSDPATNIPFSEWNATGIYTTPPNFLQETNKIVIPQLAAGASLLVQFGWAPPAPGSNLRGDDHFCLIARIENESDESIFGTGTGGWDVIKDNNNIALKNTHVKEVDEGDDADTSFFVIGSRDDDGLIIESQFMRGRIQLQIPITVLPWRNIKILEKLDFPRNVCGFENKFDPLSKMTLKLIGNEIQNLTDIIGAKTLELRDGIATITLVKEKLFIPTIYLSEKVKMPVKVSASKIKFKEKRAFVHITQLSGGQRIGGVSLELRFKKKRKNEK